MKPLFVALLLTIQAVGQQAPRGVVTGTIRNSQGEPAAEVRVTAMEVQSGIAGATAILSIAQSDSKGRYRLEDIPPGAYYIIAGRIDSPTFYPGTVNRAEARAVRVGAGTQIADIDFVVDPVSLQPPPRSISGTGFGSASALSNVKRVSGRFVVQGRESDRQIVINYGLVTAERITDQVKARVESNSSGAFTLTLEDGDYLITITPPRSFRVVSAVIDSVDLLISPLKVDARFPASSSGSGFGGSGGGFGGGGGGFGGGGGGFGSRSSSIQPSGPTMIVTIAHVAVAER